MKNHFMQACFISISISIEDENRDDEEGIAGKDVRIEKWKEDRRGISGF